ncbi:hypothetical protein OU994_30705 [Pseudoduganella sp. SL102]|uniref:hypothetical protein n=1 Tax=Pseudoduganella sp. SL102 TaxID=2995154 RepID=UPI00248BD3BE|nr:hypothetical protein [Pseudoduganella sp. SL102]WBS02559.1 hypothetical protein OU994_30705 [Pseudoduganella sp. SL102]
MFWGINIGQGIVEYDDISHLPDAFKAKDHVDFLKEDMLQIRFPNGVLIDIGWRPSFIPKGKFYIVAVKNGNWSDPVAIREAADVSEAKDAVRKLIAELT